MKTLSGIILISADLLVSGCSLMSEKQVEEAELAEAEISLETTNSLHQSSIDEIAPSVTEARAMQLASEIMAQCVAEYKIKLASAAKVKAQTQVSKAKISPRKQNKESLASNAPAKTDAEELTATFGSPNDSSPATTKAAEKTQSARAAMQRAKTEVINSKVQVLDKVQPGWYTQVSSKTHSGEAELVARLVQTLGFKTTGQQAVVKGIHYHRVMVGPFASRESALMAKKQIVRSEVLNESPFVKRIR